MKKVILITGGAGGLGRAVALKLAAENYQIAIVDYSQEGEKTAEDCQALGAEAIFIQADVSKEDEVRGFVDETIKTFGRIDVFHNNAGIMLPLRLVHEYSSEEYDRIMNINVRGAWLGIKYVIPTMMEQGGGTIINTVSSNSFKPTYGNGVYSAGKHALAGLTKSIGQDYQEQEIYCVGVAPNYMFTNISATTSSGASEEIMKKVMATTPPNIPATAEEIADVVIASIHSARQLTGTIVNCAGGQIIQ